jgi:hypothetical protein
MDRDAARRRADADHDVSMGMESWSTTVADNVRARCSRPTAVMAYFE